MTMDARATAVFNLGDLVTFEKEPFRESWGFIRISHEDWLVAGDVLDDVQEEVCGHILVNLEGVVLTLGVDFLKKHAYSWNRKPQPNPYPPGGYAEITPPEGHRLEGRKFKVVGHLNDLHDPEFCHKPDFVSGPVVILQDEEGKFEIILESEMDTLTSSEKVKTT